ncbi:MAG: tetratricopeptide repeat protein [Bacteroidota bacterium]
MATNRLAQIAAFLEESPNDPFLIFALAKEHEKLGDEEKALHYYTVLVEKHTDYVGTYYHLGKLHERSENFEAALAVYQKGVNVAKQAGDQHALSELMGAKWELEED